MDDGNNKQETKTRPKLKMGKPFQMISPPAPEETKDLQQPPPVQEQEQPPAPSPAPSPAPAKPKHSKLKSGSTPFSSKGETAPGQPQQYECPPIPMMTNFCMNPLMGGSMPMYPPNFAPEHNQLPTHVETKMKLKPRSKVLHQEADTEETPKEGLYKKVIDDFERFEQNPDQYGIEDFPEEYFEMYEEELHDQIAREFDEDWEDYHELKSANCECCKGYINKCKGSICRSLGKCQCVMRLEMEEDAVEHYIEECKNCTCCKGFVYTCLGAECKQLGMCVCFCT